MVAILEITDREICSLPLPTKVLAAVIKRQGTVITPYYSCGCYHDSEYPWAIFDRQVLQFKSKSPYAIARKFVDLHDEQTINLFVATEKAITKLT